MTEHEELERQDRSQCPGYWGKALAHELELEYLCERCHRRCGTEMYDRLFVCSPCRRVLQRKLVKHG